MKEIKFCKDCKYYVSSFTECCHPNHLVKNKTYLIDGTQYMQYCKDIRSTGVLFSYLLNKCGKGGKFYESK